MDQCVILVGGKGTRLGELTRNFPKPMIEVNGKPFLLYILDYIQRFGFKEIILLSSHGSEYLQDYFKDFKYKNCNITILKEETPLGTGGALVNSYEYLDDSFFCLNGDSIVEGNWLSIIQDFNKTCDCVVALTKVDDPKRYGTVKLENSLIKKFYEKKESENSQYINAGIYIFRKQIFKKYRKEFISLEKDILPALAEDQKIKGRYVGGYFIDIGTPTSLEEGMNRKWGEEKKAVIFDRDGTLNEDDGYTYKISDLKWKKGFNFGCTLTVAGQGYPYVVPSIPGLPVDLNEPLDCDLWWNEVDMENKKLCMTSHQTLEMGHRVCDVNAFSDNLSDAIDQVYQNIKKIRCLGSYYRLDLGKTLWPPGKGF